MFVFDTLIMSDDKSLQTLLRSVDTELLILALKGQMNPSGKLFSCMSNAQLLTLWMKWSSRPSSFDRSAVSAKGNY